MDGRRGFELMELLAVKLLLAGVWLAVRGGHEMATASMLDPGLAAIRDAGPDQDESNRSTPGPSMAPSLPPSWLETGDSRFRFDRDLVRRGSSRTKGENSAASVRAMVGTFPLRGS